jgi:hypothetical protein
VKSVWETCVLKALKVIPYMKLILQDIAVDIRRKIIPGKRMLKID